MAAAIAHGKVSKHEPLRKGAEAEKTQIEFRILTHTGECSNVLNWHSWILTPRRLHDFSDLPLLVLDICKNIICVSQFPASYWPVEVLNIKLPFVPCLVTSDVPVS